MDCHRLAIDVDDYQLPPNDPLIPAGQTLASAAALLELVFDLPEEPVHPVPEPRGNSDPHLEANSLRAPPLAWGQGYSF